jgi:hypothetical protein
MPGQGSFRLGNQVVLVQARHAIALYDLKRGRLQRLAGRGADRFRDDCLQGRRLEPDGYAGNPVTLLHQRGFLERYRGVDTEDFSPDWSVPLFPPLRTLSFEVDHHADAARADRILQFVREATHAHGLLSAVLVVKPGGEAIAAFLARELLTNAEHLLVETLAAPGCDVGRCHSPGHGVDFARRRIRIQAIDASGLAGLCVDDSRGVLASRQKVGAGVIFVHYSYFHLLKNFGESYGCLHFDAQMRVFPDIAETSYAIGHSDEGGMSLSELLSHPRTLAYWGMTKDFREKCSGCELRYACANPLAHRVDPDNLSSAPSNCDYDPVDGRWGAGQ